VLGFTPTLGQVRVATKIPISRILGFLTWESWDKNDIWVQALWPGIKNIIRGKVMALPKSRPL
jgi:hypothetical protein